MTKHSEKPEPSNSTKHVLNDGFSIKNPIIDNRIIKDKTFAIRLKSFAEGVVCSDACSQDEKESMISYAKQLLRYQIHTATDEDEIQYLKRINAKNRLR